MGIKRRVFVGDLGAYANQDFTFTVMEKGWLVLNFFEHINGIESFWAFAKTRLVRFRGLAKHTFYFHLKECEFRFNHRNEDLYKLVLKMLREEPLC